MLNCPRCHSKLDHVQGVGSNYWQCSTCRGHAMTLPLLRRRADPSAIARLWQTVQSGGRATQLPCSSCLKPMIEVDFSPAEPIAPITFDVCSRCQFLWFDSGELHSLPSYEPPPNLFARGSS